MTEGQHIRIEPDGSCFKVTSQRLAGAGQALRKMANATATRVPHAFVLNGMPGHIAVSASKTLVGVQLSALKLFTDYRLIDGKLFPTFKPGGDVIRTTCTFNVPDSMRVYFACHAMYQDRKWVPADYFFFAASTKKDVGGYFRLPLANLYADGRICMGNFSTSADSLVELVAKCVSHIDSALWKLENNTSVDPTLAKTEAVFRFDAATYRNLEVPDNWHTYCTRVSRVEMEELINGSS